MTDQSRVNAGIPTGGQFAANNRSEGEVNLNAHLQGLYKQEIATTRRVVNATGKLMATEILERYPTAAKLHVGVSEEGPVGWESLSIFDSEGQFIDEFEDDEELNESIHAVVSSVPGSEPIHYVETVKGGFEPGGAVYPWMKYGSYGRDISYVDIDLVAAKALPLD
jgi:hypothetical protein